MVEVFKTDVCDRRYAELLVQEICSLFTGYTASFDLDDCDRILRVISSGGPVDAVRVIRLIERFGFSAELAARVDSPYAGPAFMALELTPGALTGAAGRVRYSPPFEAL